MKNFISVLSECSLFSEIKEEDINSLLKCLGAFYRHFPAKTTVISEGERVDSIAIVLSGEVQIARTDCDGNRSIIGEAGKGNLFLEAFACAETEECPVSAVTLKESDIMFISCGRILHSCSNACDFHNRIIYNLMKNMAVKNIMFHEKLEVTSKKTTREKLLSYLNIQAKKKGKRSFYIPFDRQELADFLEVDRSGLSTEIGKLKKEGIINNTKNYFSI